MLRSSTFACAAVAVVLFAPSTESRAEPSAATVSGTGNIEIKRQPETLRVQIEVMARGKSLKESFEKLKARREEVREALIKLGARKEGVTFGDPGTADDASGRQNDVDRLIRDRNRALGKEAKKTEAAVIVAGFVRADFPLTGGALDEFIVASRELQDKIKAADLGGLKEKGKLTPEEQEALEEAVGRPRRGDEGDRGEPVFLFVSKVSEEDRAKALADAFARAKRDAERLAKAAGAELGGLHKLTKPFPDSGEFGDPYARYRYSNNSALIQALERTDDEVTEAIGLQPGKVSLRVGVVAEFTLKQPGGK